MITYIIIFVTVIVSIACFNNTPLFNSLSFTPYRVAKNHEWYRLITHGFVHADYTHLIINMIVFYSIGVYVEQLLKSYARADVISDGTVNYLILYFGGMIFATIYDMVKKHNNPRYTSIGASGAVSAVVFASIFFNPWGKIYFFAILPIPGIIFGVLYLAYAQYMVKRGVDGINHNAHFYGAIFGFIFPVLMNPMLLNEFFFKNLAATPTYKTLDYIYYNTLNASTT